MTVTGESLYELLPAALCRLDTESGEAVRKLLDVLGEQVAAVEADIDRLGENWFIETCAEWVVPYLGDLLGAGGLHQVSGAAATAARARVANTIRFRRRKGTLAMLEQLAGDATGWPAKAVEFFELLSTTQQLNHLRLHRPASADLRSADTLELVDGPFDRVAHTADTRRIRGERGRYNIPHIGLFLWPVGSYLLEEATVRAAVAPDDGRYLADPLGADRPLFMPPLAESGIEAFAQEENVPGVLRRRPLFDELERLRQPGGAPAGRFFGTRPVFRVFTAPKATDRLEPVPHERVHVCDLTTWRRPTQAGHVNVDPVLGRISFPTGAVPNRVAFSSAYGAGGDVGAGTYNRRGSLDAVLDRPVSWQGGVLTPEPGDPPEPDVLFPDLVSAVAAWNVFEAAHPGTFGVISVMDNKRYTGDLTGAARIRVGAGSKLAVVAAHWPKVPVPGDVSGQEVRRLGRIEPAGLRPCVAGKIEVLGTATGTDEPGELLIDGLFIDGDLRVVGAAPANLGRLVVRHTSLVPVAGGVRVNSANSQLSVDLRRCLTGPVTLPDTVGSLRISESVVQTTATRAIDARQTDITVERATVLGGVAGRKLSASNTIFTGPVQIERRQDGCARFCFVPPGSQTPRRHRCQPDLAIEKAIEQSTEPAAQVQARLAPSFVSEDFGHYGYAYLAPDAPDELLTGADDGAEIGVFGLAQRQQRLANLSSALEEFLPFGLQAAPLAVSPEE